jgi:hypothetical protein
MALWAEVDENNVVTQVAVGDSRQADGGYQWLVDNLGGTWLETSYASTTRKNYAGIGYAYDEARDAFIPPKPYLSWVLDESTCQWVPPIAHPDDGGNYYWDESETDWIEVQDESE